MHDFYGTDFNYFYGVVEEVMDANYVRVRIWGIHPIDKNKVRTDHLPPALVLYGTDGGQVTSGSSTHNLQVDTWVFGHFLDYPLCMQPIVTNVVKGAPYSSSNYSSGGGEFVGQGTGETPDVDTGAVTNIPGGSNIEKSYNYITSKLKAEGSSNDPHLHASAAVGVLMLETSGINPNVTGGYKGRAWGICQWLGPRRERLFRTFGRTKRLDQQLDFMWIELNSDEKRAKGKWLSSSSLPDAVEGFCLFERAEEYNLQTRQIMRNHGNFKKRLQFAYSIYNSMKPTS